MQFHKQSSSRFDLWPVLLQQSCIAGVIVISREQRKRHPKLRGLRTAHVDHSLFIDKVTEVIVNDLRCGREAAPFQVRINRAGEDVLKTVVFRAIVIAVDSPILWIDPSRTHHQLAHDGMTGHVRVRFFGNRDRGGIAQLPLPIFRKNKESSIERLRLRVLAAWRESGIAMPVNDLADFSVFNACGAVPRLHDELIPRLHISEHHDFQIGGV